MASLAAAMVGVACLTMVPPTVKNCSLEWHDRHLDNFNYNPDTYGSTFKQRVFVCGEDKWHAGAPIFFYCGNEADVTLYLEHTGLMWENQADFGAVLIFAEHRYYGESLPFGNSSFTPKNMAYLSHEQALADYAQVVKQFKDSRQAAASKVVAFGGSYGGMLAGWMRMKYPAVVSGAIAASAPVMAFQGAGKPSFNDTEEPTFGNAYWQVVTRDATPAAGARPNCSDAVRAAFAELFKTGSTPSGLATLQSKFKTCQPIKDATDLRKLAYLQLLAWDTEAMGNFPYPSNYLTNGGPILPAFPVRVSCESMVDETGRPMPDLLAALSDATSVFNNASSGVDCYPLPDDIEQDGIWDWQWCTEMLPQETYFGKTGAGDMFWNDPYNASWVAEHCRGKYGVAPRPSWVAEQYGGLSTVREYSNIVFSNGDYDPWSAGGVNVNATEHGVYSILIAEGAHHLDLMFSNPQDPQSVKDARAFEVENIKAWLN